LAKQISSVSSKPVETVVIQEEGGTLKAIDKGRKLVSLMSRKAGNISRVHMDLSDIVLATNCGGSDATSGMAANPVIGVVSDKIIASGGTVMIGETTELIGTEHILMERASSLQVKNNISRMIKTLEQDLHSAGVDVRGANPSPGNIRGGLSTLEEKALGGISKGGVSPIQEVVEYGALPKKKGLIIMDTPGYDIESVSGMVAGGAQVVLFSTGRGTPTGNPIAPVLKVTGNDETFKRMHDNIDFDASTIIRGKKSIEENGSNLFDLLIQVCNGKFTAAEKLGFNDFSIYHNMELWCTCSY
jgi:altronate dehydratase large subunit